MAASSVAEWSSNLCIAPHAMASSLAGATARSQPSARTLGDPCCRVPRRTICIWRCPMTTRIRTGWRLGAALCTLLGATVVSGVAMAQSGDDRRGQDGPALREDAPKPRRERAGAPEDLKNRLREYIRAEVEAGATFDEIRDSLLEAMPERFQAIAREKMAERRGALQGGRGPRAEAGVDRQGGRAKDRGNNVGPKAKREKNREGKRGAQAGPGRNAGRGMQGMEAGRGRRAPEGPMGPQAGGRMGRDDGPRADRGQGQGPGQPFGRGPSLGRGRQGPPMEAGRGGQPPRQRAGEGQGRDWRPMNAPQDRAGRGNRGPENGQRQRRPGPGPDQFDQGADRGADRKPDQGRRGDSMGDRDNRPGRRGGA
jgi:hypothetical protein